ncbi:hypothetical protein AB4144_59600, partial [Rhizobiaceae sp. 2RAB30]
STLTAASVPAELSGGLKRVGGFPFFGNHRRLATDLKRAERRVSSSSKQLPCVEHINAVSTAIDFVGDRCFRAFVL